MASSPAIPNRTPRDWSALRGDGSTTTPKARGGAPGAPKAERGGASGRGRTRAPRNNVKSAATGADHSDAKPDSAPKPDAHKPAVATPVAAGIDKKPAVANAERPGKLKGRSRQPSRASTAAAIPAVAIAPASPTVVDSAAATLRPPNRRKRSQAKPPTNALRVATAVESSPDLLAAKRSKTGPSTPTLASKDRPPHLPMSAAPDNTSFALDAFVERMRSAAIDRPSTPGSHIDWAGDDDDSLPDLDESWLSPAETKDNFMSPILVDTLRHLPAPRAPFPAAPVEEDTRPSDALLGTRMKPGPLDLTVEQSTPNSEDSTRTPIAPSTPKAQNGVGESMHAPAATEGLAASIHAPKKVPESPSASSKVNTGSPIPTAPRGFNPTHNRAHTVDRHKQQQQQNPPHTAPTSGSPQRFNGRPARGAFTREGSSSHARTHSTPTHSSGLRAPHNTRPVLTGDALSRLARSIGGISPSRSAAKE